MVYRPSDLIPGSSLLGRWTPNGPPCRKGMPAVAFTFRMRPGTDDPFGPCGWGAPLWPRNASNVGWLPFSLRMSRVTADSWEWTRKALSRAAARRSYAGRSTRRKTGDAGNGRLPPAGIARTRLSPRRSRHPGAPAACRSSRCPRRRTRLCDLQGAWQSHRELGEFARAAVDSDCAAMLLHDDVIADRQAEPGAFASRLGREERREQLCLHLGRHPDAVVAHFDLDLVTEIARRHPQ